MSEREKETKFLKTLIRCDESDHGRQLQARIERAEKDEKCIRSALYMVGLVVLLSLAGLGYSAVFVPQFTQYSSHIATKIFCAIGLGSLICFMLFLGYWLWYRAVSNRVFAECRRFLREIVEARIKDASVDPTQMPSANGGFSVYQNETPKSQDEPVVVQFSKAS